MKSWRLLALAILQANFKQTVLLLSLLFIFHGKAASTKDFRTLGKGVSNNMGINGQGERGLSCKWKSFSVQSH